MQRLINILFGCTHGHRSFPHTTRDDKRTYVVCLDCGKEMPYDWATMKLGTAS